MASGHSLPPPTPLDIRDLTIRQRRQRRGTFLLPVTYCAWEDFWDGGVPSRVDVLKPCLTLCENVEIKTQLWQMNQGKNETLRLNLKNTSLFEISETNRAWSLLYTTTNWMERDLTYFALYLFVIVLHSLSLSFLITYFPTFFSIKKREQLSLILFWVY